MRKPVRPPPARDPLVRASKVEPIRWRGDRLELLDQRLLPEKTAYVTCRTAEQVAKIAAPLGIAPQALVAATQDPAIKARLKEETDRSIERGVFGSPFVFVDDEPFWGADRLDQIERWLATGGW